LAWVVSMRSCRISDETMFFIMCLKLLRL
jgi:hypothetical protein